VKINEPESWGEIEMNTAKEHEIKPGVSVCAWCRCEFDTTTGEPIRRLSDAEYAAVVSHGCCKVCSSEMMKEFRSEKANQVI
jgi:hypothetical protein